MNAELSDTSAPMGMAERPVPLPAEMPSAPQTVRQEFARNWLMLLAASMGVGLSSMHAYSVGIFLGPIHQAFGWPPEKILAGLGLISVMAGVGSPICGHFMDRLGARVMGLTGTIVFAAGTAALAIIPASFPLFLACFALIGVGTIMASPMVWQRNVVERFVKGRGLAVSVALCGSNVAGAVSPLLATLFIESYNWRVAYLAVASYMLLSTLPLAWLYFRDTPAAGDGHGAPPSDAPPADLSGITLADALRTREFWLVTIAFTLAGVGIAGYVVHLAPMLTAQGFSLILAATAVSVLSISAICGRLIAGALMDHMFAPHLAAIALALPMMGSLAILLIHPTYWTAIFAAITVGLSTGAEFNMISYLTAQYFGLRHFGVIGGIVFGTFMIGCLGGQMLPPYILKVGTYHDVLVMFTGSFLVASVLLFFCRPYAAIRHLFRH